MFAPMSSTRSSARSRAMPYVCSTSTSLAIIASRVSGRTQRPDSSSNSRSAVIDTLLDHLGVRELGGRSLVPLALCPGELLPASVRVVDLVHLRVEFLGRLDAKVLTHVIREVVEDVVLRVVPLVKEADGVRRE